MHGQLLYIVEDVNFWQLMKHLAPWYSIFLQRTMSQPILLTMHREHYRGDGQE